nr:hypothetical protein [Tanacetum cinerariifolium]
MTKAKNQRSHSMKEQAYNIIKNKDSRTQRQSNLKKFKEARFKISPREFKDHTLGKLLASKYVFEHGSSESAGSLASGEIVSLKLLRRTRKLGYESWKLGLYLIICCNMLERVGPHETRGLCKDEDEDTSFQQSQVHNHMLILD